MNDPSGLAVAEPWWAVDVRRVGSVIGTMIGLAVLWTGVLRSAYMFPWDRVQALEHGPVLLVGSILTLLVSGAWARLGHGLLARLLAGVAILYTVVALVADGWLFLLAVASPVIVLTLLLGALRALHTRSPDDMWLVLWPSLFGLWAGSQNGTPSGVLATVGAIGCVFLWRWARSGGVPREPR